ncbi:hypothetical protein P4O66_008366 [Electrophorus voltai]|uniref:Type I cytokine receptor cytokine-binding domain-containing protein n=1 Tax=Electrophorus voltai TaxID=2609070 RepID=A0AAD9DWW3_9TELE|nr:hypothetical protein P4O66_008366 [Electrophorus voltai]
MLRRYWEIFLIIYFSFMCVVVDTVSVHQPQHPSVSWETNHFSVTAQWSEPAVLDAGCKATYNVELYSMKCPPEKASYISEWPTQELNYTWHIYEVIDAKCVALHTIFQGCGNKTYSNQVYKDIPQPQVACLVPEAQSNRVPSSCMHKPTNPSTYCIFLSDKKDSLKPCVVYTGNGPMRTGCHLYGEEFLSYDWLYILFNGTHESRPIRNMFLKNPRESVTSQPPKLHITRDRDLLVFQSSRPDFKEECWLYIFHINKCSEGDQVHTGDKHSNWSVRVPYDEACRYTVRVQANYSYLCGKGASDWSEPEDYGANNDPLWSLKATVVVIPVIMSCCLLMALILFRRYKDKILPKVPEPSLLFSDVFNDKNEGKITKDLHVDRIYVPSEEVVETTLHLEPKHLKA